MRLLEKWLVLCIFEFNSTTSHVDSVSEVMMVNITVATRSAPTPNRCHGEITAAFNAASETRSTLAPSSEIAQFLRIRYNSVSVFF